MGNGSPRLHTHLTRRVALVVLAALFGAPAAHADTLAPVVPASPPAVDPATTVATVTAAVEPVAAAAGAVADTVTTTAPVVVEEQVRPVVAAVARSVRQPAIALPHAAPKQLHSSVSPAAPSPTTDAQQRPVVRQAKSAERAAQPRRRVVAATSPQRHVQTAASAAAPGSAVPGAQERAALVIPHGTVAAVGARPSPAPHAPHLSPAPPLSDSPGTAGWTDDAGAIGSTGGILAAVVLGFLSLARPRPGRRQPPRARLPHPVVPLLVLERPG